MRVWATPTMRGRKREARSYPLRVIREASMDSSQLAWDTAGVGVAVGKLGQVRVRPGRREQGCQCPRQQGRRIRIHDTTIANRC